jgi:hypothetical protein
MFSQTQGNQQGAAHTDASHRQEEGDEGDHELGGGGKGKRFKKNLSILVPDSGGAPPGGGSKPADQPAGSSRACVGAGGGVGMCICASACACARMCECVCVHVCFCVRVRVRVSFRDAWELKLCCCTLACKGSAHMT